MSQLYGESLQYLYNLSNRHLAIATIQIGTDTYDYASQAIDIFATTGSYSITATFDLTNVPMSFSLTKLRYYAYKDSTMLYGFDIDIRNVYLQPGTYIINVTVYVSDSDVRWTLS